MAVRRSARIPILTGESLALIEGFRPFIQNQAVDCLQPDLVHAGGITGTKSLHQSYCRLPMATELTAERKTALRQVVAKYRAG